MNEVQIDFAFNSRLALASAIWKPNYAHIACETIDDEVIIIHLKTGSYYSLESVGANIWSLIKAGSTTAKIISKTLEQ